ncbi:TIMD4 protein, partial [Hippolais icterina]|nr:TIMD4 protein [Hippolais icterina]
HTVSEDIVRGTVGQPVTLPCSYSVMRPRDVSDMCWGRGRCPNSKCRNEILHTRGIRVNKVKSKEPERYNLHGKVFSGDVSLTIGAARAEDAGLYCCRVEIPGPFNDIKKNIRLELVRAPPVTTTTTTTTTTTAPVFYEDFTETFAPQATSDLQPTPEIAVLLTTSILPPETTAPESPAVTTEETSAPPTTAVTENDIFPVTVVEMTTPSDFPATSQVVTTEDVIFCSTLPGITEVTTEFPGTLPTAEETTTSAMMEEEMSVMATALPVPAILQTPKISLLIQESNPSCADSSEGKVFPQPFQFLFSPFQFPSSAILIACAIVGSVLFILMISLVWKRKHTKKFITKSVGPPEETDKVFSGAEGENNIFSL